MSLNTLNRRDLWFTGSGDFIIDESGDLKSTTNSADIHEGIRQAILHRVIGERNAWRLHPTITAGLDRFIGDTINDELIDILIVETKNAIKTASDVEDTDIIIRALEVIDGAVAIMIWINSTGQDNPLLTLSYSIQSGSVSRIK
jgi:hypothetical protein